METTQEEKKIVDLNTLSPDGLRALKTDLDEGGRKEEIITDAPEEAKEKLQEAEPKEEYNVEIISKPDGKGEEEINVHGEQSSQKAEDGKIPETKKEELTYEQFTTKYPDLKEKINEDKFKEMFKVEEETPSTQAQDTPVELQKVTLDYNDEIELTKRLDSSIKGDGEIKRLLLDAGLKAFPKDEDEMDAFAEAFPRKYMQFERRQEEIAEQITKGYISDKEIKLNAPVLRKRNIEDFGALVEADMKELYPNIENDKEALAKVTKAVLDFYGKASMEQRYHVNVSGELIPSKEKLYTGFTNMNRALYSEIAKKDTGVVANKGDGKKILEEIKKEVKKTPMTTLQDSVKSGAGSNVRTVNAMDENELTALSLDTLKAMRKKIQAKL